MPRTTFIFFLFFFFFFFLRSVFQSILGVALKEGFHCSVCYNECCIIGPAIKYYFLLTMISVHVSLEFKRVFVWREWHDTNVNEACCELLLHFFKVYKCFNKVFWNQRKSVFHLFQSCTWVSSATTKRVFIWWCIVSGMCVYWSCSAFALSALKSVVYQQVDRVCSYKCWLSFVFAQEMSGMWYWCHFFSLFFSCCFIDHYM